jgi:hypothetical protein
MQIYCEIRWGGGGRGRWKHSAVFRVEKYIGRRAVHVCFLGFHQGQEFSSGLRVIPVQNILKVRYNESGSINSLCRRLNMELDLQSLFGLLCTAVLIG